MLSKKNVKGAILWGIVASTVVAWIFAIVSPITAATYGITTPKGIFKFESIVTNCR